jgi:hypothetical protein
MAVDSGKWYWEVTPTSMDGPGYRRGYIGVGDATRTGSNYGVNGYEGNTGYGQSTGSYGYWASNGNKYQGDGTNWSNTTSAYGDAYEPNDVIGVALDLDNGKIWFSKNGTWQASGDPVAGTNAAFTGVSGPKTPLIKAYRDTGVSFIANANFGQSSFAYTPPTGFNTLRTANLPEPAIGPNSATQSDEHFNTILWTGDGTNNRAITGVGFQPDFTWVKGRSAAEWNILYDAVRGANKALYSNDTTYDEQTTTNTFESFDTDGFTVSYNSAYSSVFTNKSGTTYVGWNWKGNGSGVSNTDGDVTSTVSANTDAGISICTFTTPSTGQGFTVGHGLGVAPDFLILRGLQTYRAWWVWHKDFSPTYYYLYLHATYGFSGLTQSTNAWNNAVPTSTVFSTRSDWQYGTNIPVVAYAFAEVEGFSKFGSYTGNGSADGPFIYTGFRPAFVMIKRTNAAENWAIIDGTRDPYNVATKFLRPDETSAETAGTAVNMDLLSNGFKLKSTDPKSNASGSTYIYMAFAEMPFKYSVGR